MFRALKYIVVCISRTLESYPMKIIKISAHVSKMSNEEINRELLSSPPVERALSLLNEAYNRGTIDIFLTASDNPRYVNNLPIVKLIIRMAMLEGSSTTGHAESIVHNILEYSETLDPSIINEINALATSPKITSILLLHQNTPNTIIESIMKMLHLNIVRQVTLANSIYLTAIIDDLENGESWNNEYSGSMFMPRLSMSNQDPFLTKVSTFNVTPPFALQLLYAADQIKGQNPSLKRNIEANKYAGVEMARMLYSNGGNWDNAEPQQIILPLIKLLTTGNTSVFHWVWKTLKEKIKNEPEWKLAAFNNMYDDENLIDIVIQFYPDLIPDLIDILRSTTNIDSIKGSISYGKIIHEGLNNPLYKEQILSLPEQYFRMIRTTKEDAQIIQDHFHPRAQTESFDDYKEFQDLMGSNNNWYIRYSMTQEMLKEAGWKENLTMTLLSAILTVLGGSNVEAASKKHNIKEDDLRMALQNKETVMKAKEMQSQQKVSEQSQTNINTIVNLIIKHEGLLPKQTPFRITNPEMKKWTTIHGFKIDNTTPKPKGRENFIFLANAEDVPKAIKKQLMNYANKPSRYGLNHEPSLKEALSIFDQTGVQGKLKFLIEQLPTLDITKKLSSFFV